MNISTLVLASKWCVDMARSSSDSCTYKWNWFFLLCSIKYMRAWHQTRAGNIFIKGSTISLERLNEEYIRTILCSKPGTGWSLFSFVTVRIFIFEYIKRRCFWQCQDLKSGCLLLRNWLATSVMKNVWCSRKYDVIGVVERLLLYSLFLSLGDLIFSILLVWVYLFYSDPLFLLIYRYIVRLSRFIFLPQWRPPW